jgi:hypothetical protein
VHEQTRPPKLDSMQRPFVPVMHCRSFVQLSVPPDSMQSPAGGAVWHCASLSRWLRGTRGPSASGPLEVPPLELLLLDALVPELLLDAPVPELLELLLPEPLVPELLLDATPLDVVPEPLLEAAPLELERVPLLEEPLLDPPALDPPALVAPPELELERDPLDEAVPPFDEPEPPLPPSPEVPLPPSAESENVYD